MPLAVLLAACALAQDPKEIRIERDIAFGKGGDVVLKLDLALPPGDGPFPAVVCLHGGLWWNEGKRQDMQATVEALARRGFVALTVDYRLASQARYPAALEDCKAAVRWLRANAVKYGVDPERVGALGSSSGAHLACLLGTTDANDGLEGDGGHAKESSKVQAVVSFFGLTDLTKKTWTPAFEEKVLAPFLGGTFDRSPELYRRASPLHFVKKDAPPFLFCHGDRDQVVRISQSRTLADRLHEVGTTARVDVVEGEGHGWKGDKLWESIARAVLFLDAQLKRQ